MSKAKPSVIPASVVVGPYTYPVERTKKLTSDDGRDLWGHIDHSGPTRIQILADAPDDRAWVTLLHESLHVIDELTAARLSERQITVLAPALAAFLIANGWGPKE